ncbi:exocyst complex component Sec6 [Mycena rebaudengoi]|nr:exocyst complex component Sec6 [Mycena rebaudengoi]
MAAAPVSAAQAIGEYLQSPDDLVKIQTFRKKLEKEKASIDARLKAAKLLGTRNNVQIIKDEMAAIERQCADPQNIVATFDQISRVRTAEVLFNSSFNCVIQVSLVHRNFEQTEETVNNLLEMNSKLDVLEDMLETDSRDILGPAPNLLVIHFLLNQLEAFRNQTMHQAKKASANSRATLARYFERLNNVIEAFDQYVVGLAGNVLDLVRAGHSDVVVKLIKIAEVEGREDEKLSGSSKRPAKLDAASKFKSMQANARVIKHYRSKITKAIAESIKLKFEEAYKRDEQDPANFLGSLGWMYQDLIRLESDVVPCFPSEYEIYSLYVREYHKALNTTIKTLVATEPGASVLLTLFEWLKDYKKDMKELGVPPELLEPALLDGKEQSLIEDYLMVIIKKLDEWSANLMKTEVEEFTARREPPEVDSEGLYGSQGGAAILFQMVNQQLISPQRVAREPSSLALSAKPTVSCEAYRNSGSRSSKPNSRSRRINRRRWRVVWWNTLSPWLMTRSNPPTTPRRCWHDSSHSFQEKYRVTINERLNDAIDGYLDVAKKCTQTLIDIIFNDLKPATKSLFQPAWYDGIMRQIVETMRDYMTDYQTYLNPSLLELLVEDLLDAFLVVYLNGLANSPKLKMPAATERIKEDVSVVFSFFSTMKPARELEAYFDVVEKILALLEASKDLVFLSFWAFARIHGPNIAFVEGLMKARADLDRSAKKVKDEGLTDPPEPTIMKKIAIQNSFSRFLR